VRFYLRLIILSCFFVLGIYFVAGRLTDIRVAGEVSTIKKQTNNAETALKVLTQNCGQCHQSTLPTANPKALEIFDLDKKDWYKSVSDKHLESISKRIGTKSGISETERTATQDFIARVRKGDCQN
jgi:hypothetical protein